MFDLQGHRGARGLWPENTLAGFRAALAAGIASIELDVGVTRDGVAVVAHDLALTPDLTRGPDGAWLTEPGPLVASLTLAELRRFDVGRQRLGSAGALRFPEQAACDGERVPTLAEVLALALHHQATLHVELKTDPRRPDATIAPEAMADLVAAAADRAGAAGLTVIRAFDWRGLRHLRRTRPDLALAWLSDAETERDPALWWDLPAGVAEERSTPRAVAAEAFGPGRPDWTPIWAACHRGLTAWQIGEAHALGLRVIPWTVNDAADMARLIALGVDGLCTDRPDRAGEVMAAFAMTTPSPR